MKVEPDLARPDCCGARHHQAFFAVTMSERMTNSKLIMVLSIRRGHLRSDEMHVCSHVSYRVRQKLLTSLSTNTELHCHSDAFRSAMVQILLTHPL